MKKSLKKSLKTNEKHQTLFLFIKSQSTNHPKTVKITSKTTPQHLQKNTPTSNKSSKKTLKHLQKISKKTPQNHTINLLNNRQ